MYVLLLGNVGLPLTSGFIGELCLLKGIFINNKLIGMIVGLSMVLCNGYSLLMFNKIVFGNINVNLIFLKDFSIKFFIIMIVLVM